VVNRDFQEFFESLNASRVRYLLIGGVAYNAYAPPRATKDIDIWVDSERENLVRLKAAVGRFGFPTDQLDLEALAMRHQVVMLGRAPHRIDILTRPPGVPWAEAWARKVPSAYGDVPIQVIAAEDLLRQKRAAGRPQDLLDAAKLAEIARRRASDPSGNDEGSMP